LLLVILNVVRICSLYYVGVLFPSSFEFMHLELWPALIVIAAVAGFVGFTIWARRADDVTPVAA
jgi:exosortase/archaeosortase family protein